MILLTVGCVKFNAEAVAEKLCRRMSSAKQYRLLKSIIPLRHDYSFNNSYYAETRFL